MKYPVFHGRDSISVIAFLNEFNRAYEASGIHDGTSVWLFIEFLNDPDLAIIEARLTVSSKDTNRRKCSITICAEVVSHLLKGYNTDAISAKANGEIGSLKQGSLTLSDFFQTL